MDDVQPTKAELRAAMVAARRAVPDEVRRAEAAALAQHLTTFAVSGDTVCAYVPVGSEPGSVAMLDLLLAAGTRVLLPVARQDDAGTPLALSWGEYGLGELVDARFGLREPRPPWLPTAAIATVAAVIVPALAVDRAGVRLGRGAGFYDRTLALAGSSTRLIAMVRDDELVDRLPGEPHDVPMTHVVTPAYGLVELRSPGRATATEARQGE